MEFLNKIVLVTGASRGLGKQIVIDFVQQGAHVIINYNKSKKEAYDLKKMIEDLGFEVDVIKADISNEDEVSNMINTIISKYGYIDIIINNAAISNDSIISMKNKIDLMKILEVNLVGTFLVCKYASNYINKDGCIINISSTDAIDSNYVYGLDYDASKAGVISLTSNFAKALRPIRVNTVCPGWIDTDMNKDMSLEFKNKQLDRIILNRFGSVEEVSNVVLFLASEKASYINNSIIRVDGGRD